MCGLFGIFGTSPKSAVNFVKFAKMTERRGSDASGLIYSNGATFDVRRANYRISKLWKQCESAIPVKGSQLIMGHSRMMTNGYKDNQPIIRDNIAVLHNGIIVNAEKLWRGLDTNPNQEIDTEILIGLAHEHISNNLDFKKFSKILDENVVGSVSVIMLFKELRKIFIYTNNGSLYHGTKLLNTVVASEKNTLENLGVENIQQVRKYLDLDLPSDITAKNWHLQTELQNENLIPKLTYNSIEAKYLKYDNLKLRRCTKCILPETMPYISFNEVGVCNYCENYQKRNAPKPLDDLIKILKNYRKQNGPECIVPFSGGRDSSFGLHLICEEIGLKPITYTYDWGMVTDLARRNISRMCADLNVENILVSANISQKRNNIKKNLSIWLKKPDLGMVSILTAGDKHFFKWIEHIKNETGVNLNIWSVNPLEVTHFKAGFLGIRPKFMNQKVYNSGLASQFDYHKKRFRKMFQNPGYYNRSLIDTLSGEYYRSLLPKTDYFHLFDYWKWDETEINKTLEKYDWEIAPDTNSTWRIGDGTAAFYNYVYYTMAGFTEHDTFRSNQVREGDITRSKALELVADENRPRYENIKWYLDVVGIDFMSAIKAINSCALKQ